MTTYLRTIAVICLLSLLMVIEACKKEDSTPIIPVPSTTELLTRQDWYLIESTYYDGTSNFSTIPNCYKDNILSFSADNTFSYSPNKLRCSPNEQTDTGKWGLDMTISWPYTYQSGVAGGTYAITEISGMRLAMVCENCLGKVKCVFAPTGVSKPITLQQQQVYDQIVARRWRLSSCIASLDNSPLGTVVTNEYAALPACRRDDFLQFSLDNTFTNNEGATKCNSSDPQSNTGGWAVNQYNAAYVGVRPNILNLPFIDNPLATVKGDTLILTESSSSRSGLFRRTAKYAAF